MALVLFLLGSPGVGKTSLARRLLGMDRGREPTLLWRPKWSFTDTVCAAGHYKGELFDGADTIPYNGAKEVLEWWSRAFLTWPLTVFDGDRMSTKGTLEFLDRFNVQRYAILLQASPLDLIARRLERGSKQNPAWIKGRETKSERFAEQVGAFTELNTSLLTMENVYDIVIDELLSQGVDLLGTMKNSKVVSINLT
jgi:hypothetical protein